MPPPLGNAWFDWISQKETKATYDKRPFSTRETRFPKTPKDAQTENFETFFWKLAKLTEEVAGGRVGYRKTHKIQTLNPYISLFKILLILRKLRKVRNDKVNSFLLFGNRTKINEKSPLFGGPYRNSDRQFFYSPIRRAWSICTTLHLQVKSFLKVHSSGAHGCQVQINGCAPGTTVDLNVYLKV